MLIYALENSRRPNSVLPTNAAQMEFNLLLQLLNGGFLASADNWTKP